MGTLIFVGILFTAVIPMLLVMRQADTLHEMRKHELGLMDEENSREYLRVRALPAENSPEGLPCLIVKVENKGDVVTKLVRIWINEGDEERNFLLNTNDFYEETFTISDENKNYSVIVSTDKGNLFASDNALSYKDDAWVQDEVYAIYVRISYQGVVFHIEVTYPNEDTEDAMVHSMGGTAFKVFKVPEPGTYNVKIKTGPHIIHDAPVTIYDGPYDPKSVWIDA